MPVPKSPVTACGLCSETVWARRLSDNTAHVRAGRVGCVTVAMETVGMGVGACAVMTAREPLEVELLANGRRRSLSFSPGENKARYFQVGFYRESVGKAMNGGLDLFLRSDL
ncbi:hypothetical protein CEXT_190711 [Caerostris extrusa]|uniref:Uncharacterized protein n=1 Tax=Caerostris extrusa TaxID=172846 RepID=A0AAV4SZJ6_CAEEX|nr:hypothetical protein CEXT_190711 [Caerostris extrusa]